MLEKYVTGKLRLTTLTCENYFQLGKPFPFLWVGSFYVIVHHITVPGLQFARVWFTSEVTKVTPPCPSHFIVYSGSFFNTCINIIIVPLEPVPGGRHILVDHVVRGGGNLLLHPGVDDV